MNRNLYRTLISVPIVLVTGCNLPSVNQERVSACSDKNLSQYCQKRSEPAAADSAIDIETRRNEALRRKHEPYQGPPQNSQDNTFIIYSD